MSRDEVEAWLRRLNDARLALGVTLAITEDHDPTRLDATDPASQPFFVYDWLTMLQGTILEVVFE